MVRYIVALLLLFTFVASASATSKDDSVIVPGSRIGPIAIGATLGELEELLGPPVSSYPNQNTYVWHPLTPSGDLMAVIGPDGKVAMAKIYWDVKYATQDLQLHTGMLEGDVRGILGRPRKTYKWSHYRVLYYRGISFTVDLENMHIVTGIGVYPNRVVLAQADKQFSEKDSQGVPAI